MKAKRISITTDALHELFRYNPESGKLFWKLDMGNRKAGTEAGKTQAKGYRSVKIYGRNYLAHRLVWLMTYGEIREDLEIDHKDGARDNNRIRNLRLVTTHENSFNQVRARGCHWRKDMKKWVAYIYINRQKIHLGHFNNERDARNAYLKAKKKYHQIKRR